jgi:two-component system, chemotaxis family, chemotaxis protein CheY
MREFAQQKANILLVDRNMNFGRMLRSELIHAGFRHIRIATDTEEALDCLAGDRFDAVLCDSETGPVRGPSFAQAARIRDGMVDPFVPIIMLSFIPTLRRVAACRDAGANTFLAKPVCNAQLTEKLYAALTERRRFVKVSNYFGPERRKGMHAPYRGTERRRIILIEGGAITGSRLSSGQLDLDPDLAPDQVTLDVSGTESN